MTYFSELLKAEYLKKSVALGLPTTGGFTAGSDVNAADDAGAVFVGDTKFISVGACLSQN